jgi:arginine kinase
LSDGDHVSLVQKHLAPDCWNWFSKKTKLGSTIVNCVRAAIENPECEVGLYASDPECYETFSEIFFPVISEYHGIDASAVRIAHDFGNADALCEIDKKYLSSVLQIRLFAARTLEDYPMASKLNREKREQIEELAKESFKSYHGDLYGDYYSLTELSDSERDKLIESNLLFENAKDKVLASAGCFNDWFVFNTEKLVAFDNRFNLIFPRPLNRGMFMSRNRNFVVWVNEQDHLNVVSLEKGTSMNAAYSRLLKGLEALDKTLKFVHHENFGYLNFSPTNIGTGLRVCVQLKLPHLSASNRVKDLCESLKLSVHDASTETQLGVYEISNRATIGMTEFEILSSVWNGVKSLLAEEFA